jgi:hypothetical protein
MAVIPTRLCDACGTIESAKREVVHIDAKRSDGLRTVGDLCTRCIESMEKQFGLSTTNKKRRSTFQVQD